MLRELHARCLVGRQQQRDRPEQPEGKAVRSENAPSCRLIAPSCSCPCAAAAFAAGPDSLVLPGPRNAASWSAFSLRGRPGTAAFDTDAHVRCTSADPPAKSFWAARRYLAEISNISETLASISSAKQVAAAPHRNGARRWAASSELCFAGTLCSDADGSDQRKNWGEATPKTPVVEVSELKTRRL